MVVLTADRPPELLNCGAPQTIDQFKLFGNHARGFLDLGVPQIDVDSKAVERAEILEEMGELKRLLEKERAQADAAEVEAKMALVFLHQVYISVPLSNHFLLGEH